ncbi:MAG: hypothetical protein IPJ77_09420 [Planctomycetes bacterium]|nr:hypothetical protein [Planctomycetota bacterium]
MTRTLALLTSLLATLVLPSAQPDGPTPTNCIKTCAPSYGSESTSDWIIVLGNTTPGDATAECATCNGCKGGASWTYVGTGSWTIFYPQGLIIGGSGPTVGSARLKTDCDSTELGTIAGQVGSDPFPTSFFSVQLFCTCPI